MTANSPKFLRRQSAAFRVVLAIAAVIALAIVTVRDAPAAPVASDLRFDKIADSFSEPIFVTGAGDGSGRLFVVEQDGRVKIVKNGQVLPTPFLDISDRVGRAGEAGLLSIAFPPDYATEGYFFVSYNHKDKNLAPPPSGEPNDGYDTVIARFRVSGDTDRADPTSEERILVRNQPYTNHNGGLIAFGQDGHLYIGLGDGGSGGDPLNSGQRLDTILGKMLRLQVGKTGGYTIPAGNPFVGQAGAKPEIWDLGLRNPWRWSFDRVTGDQWLGDVGQNAYEEIDLHPASTPGGLNFGWRCREGFHPYNEDPPCNSTLTDPILDYPHDASRSVTGGYVYRGKAYPSLRGRYFYADFASGKVWSIARNGSGWTSPQLEADTDFLISSFGEDESGELYMLDYGGRLYRVATNTVPPPDLSSSTKRAHPENVAPNGLVLYTVRMDNSGGPTQGAVTLTDTLPAGLNYLPGTLAATAGTVDESQAPVLAWRGTIAAGDSVTLEYQAIVAADATGRINNRAQLSAGAIQLTLTAPITVTESGLPANPDFVLPGTQPGTIVDEIVDPDTCNGCHTAPICDAWRGSMMAQAGRDPVFWAALAVAEQDAPGAGEFCLRCHTPKGWLAGRSHAADGSALEPGDISAGIACETCHRMVDPVATGASDAASTRDAVLRAAIQPPVPPEHVSTAMMILDPLDNRRGPFQIDPAPPHPRATWQTGFLGQGVDPVTEARVCATCHNLDNPTLSWDAGRGQYWPNAAGAPAPSLAKGDLFPIERTYEEWLNSDYATTAGVYAPQFAGKKPDGVVRTCQDCHMPRTTGTAAIGDNFRDCQTNGCLPEHALVGGNTWAPKLLQDPRWRLNASTEATQLDATVLRARSMLQRAASLTMTVVASGTEQAAIVRVINESGHKLPTGYAEGRRMWLAVQGYDAAGKVIFSSGDYDLASGVLQADPYLKVYEVKQGLTPELATERGLAAGESFHFVLNNDTVKDNRIPPRGYTVANFDQPGMRPVGATFADGQYWDETIYPLPAAVVSVAVVLYYQSSSKEYIDFLRAEGGADGATLGQLWDDLKSPPEVMAVAVEPGRALYLPAIGRQ
ncbi:MAG: PQQ-dependent sugar dehydrogenase [Anaerolineales bacterium]|nr:PQQ-dependent sugar dehydrogenase [Anaerolineales bacterium]